MGVSASWETSVYCCKINNNLSFISGTLKYLNTFIQVIFPQLWITGLYKCHKGGLFVGNDLQPLETETVRSGGVGRVFYLLFDPLHLAD